MDTALVKSKIDTLSKFVLRLLDLQLMEFLFPRGLGPWFGFFAMEPVLLTISSSTALSFGSNSLTSSIFANASELP